MKNVNGLEVGRERDSFVEGSDLKTKVMGIFDVEISRLLPIEIRDGIDLNWCKYLPSISNYDPITLIRFDEEFFVGDGHHRTISRLMRNEQVVRANILETDMDLEPCNEGVCIYFYTLNELKNYCQLLRKDSIEEGVISFGDYLK